jgi:hypothetical protein
MRHILIPAVGDLRQSAIYILSLNVAKGKDIVAYCRELSLRANASAIDLPVFRAGLMAWLGITFPFQQLKINPPPFRFSLSNSRLFFSSESK